MRTIYTDDHWENDPFLMLDRIRAVRAERVPHKIPLTFALFVV